MFGDEVALAHRLQQRVVHGVDADVGAAADEGVEVGDELVAAQAPVGGVEDTGGGLGGEAEQRQLGSGAGELPHADAAASQAIEDDVDHRRLRLGARCTVGVEVAEQLCRRAESSACGRHAGKYPPSESVRASRPARLAMLRRPDAARNAMLRAEVTPKVCTSARPTACPGSFGLVVTRIAEGALDAEVALQPWMLAPNGFLHAASVLLLADTAAGYASIAHLPDGAKNFTTIELKSNFLGTVRDGTIRTECRAEHLGRTTQVWSCVGLRRRRSAARALSLHAAGLVVMPW